MFISEDEVRGVLSYEALIPAIRAALIDYTAGRVEQPARTIIRAGNAEWWRNGWFAVMPVIHGDVMGVKTVTFFPGNVDMGLHTHMAVVELLRRATGEPLAVMDGRLITEIGEILANPGGVGVPRGRVLFKSVGMAIEDLAAARLVWEAQSGAGTG